MKKRSLRHILGFAFRKATWWLRPLPEFLIIGTQKGGTWGLFTYLAQHPGIVGPTKKEVHYFDDKNGDSYDQGPTWYRAHFPVRMGSASRPLAFEASPLYLFNPLAAGRIAELMPDARMIALLRNPADRAISHYFLEARSKREPLPMLEAFQKEEERLAPVLERGEYHSMAFKSYSYLARGRYREQLQRYFEHFSREQFYITNSERLLANPEKVLEEVFSFVGADPGFRVPDLEPKNVTSNRSEVPPEAYDYLNAYFRPHNEALYELLGEDFGW